MENNIYRKRAKLFSCILLGSLFVIWLAIILLPEELKEMGFLFLWAVFSLLPILATIVTRKMTNDHTSWHLKPNFKKSWRTYLLAMLVPSALIFVGAILFYIIFPLELDLTARKLYESYSMYGAPADLLLTTKTILVIGMIAILASPLVLPFHIFALGEEIGWRGYLLPNLLKLMNRRSAILLNGLLWGIAHAPLIYFHFNYGTDYWGEPYTGIGVMILICIILGVWLSFVTIKSSSILPAAILHGSINVIGELPVMVSFSKVSVLLGPNPSGLIGMSGLIIGGIVILIVIKKVNASSLL